MDNEMIERVATAITERRTGRGYNSIELAIAAIKAMREPTDEMKALVGVHWDYGCYVCGGLTEGWYAMIDSITGNSK